MKLHSQGWIWIPSSLAFKALGNLPQPTFPLSVPMNSYYKPFLLSGCGFPGLCWYHCFPLSVPSNFQSVDFHPQAFLPQPPKPTIPFYSLALLTVLQGPVQVQSHLLYKCSSDHLHNVSFLWMLMGFVTCNQFVLAFFGYVIIHVHMSVCFVRP